MLTQSSFLIRCWLESGEHPLTVKRYRIEHVQTGKHFDSVSLEEIQSWMSSTNHDYVAQVLAQPIADNEEASQ